MFQLKRRLERLKVSQLHDSLSLGSLSEAAQPHESGVTSSSNDNDDSADDPADAEGHGDDEIAIDTNGICDGKPETGNRTVRARFGRRRIHNEELCVTSCGAILGHAPMYGSEAPNGVRVSVVSLTIIPHCVDGNISDIHDGIVPYKSLSSRCNLA